MATRFSYKQQKKINNQGKISEKQNNLLNNLSASMFLRNDFQCKKTSRTR